MTRSADDWRDWRRSVKARAPYVSRRTHEQLERRYRALVEALHGRISRADEAPLRVVKPISAGLAGEVCLFVTHAGQPTIKSHVLHHVAQLHAAGIAVVVIANTDLPLDAVHVPPELAQACDGLLVRANLGLDFAAWSHAFGLADRTGWERLYLVNDSIVGPLFPPVFQAMLGRIRASCADHLGLTWNTQPVRHLQSYFLVFNRDVIRSETLLELMANVRNFDDKGEVVDFYEVRLTQVLQDAGFTCDTAFPDFAGGLGDSAHLLQDRTAAEESGFPYVKTSLLKRYPADARVAWIRQEGQVDGQV